MTVSNIGQLNNTSFYVLSIQKTLSTGIQATALQSRNYPSIVDTGLKLTHILVEVYSYQVSDLLKEFYSCGQSKLYVGDNYYDVIPYKTDIIREGAKPNRKFTLDFIQLSPYIYKGKTSESGNYSSTSSNRYWNVSGDVKTLLNITENIKTFKKSKVTNVLNNQISFGTKDYEILGADDLVKIWYHPGKYADGRGWKPELWNVDPNLFNPYQKTYIRPNKETLGKINESGSSLVWNRVPRSNQRHLTECKYSESQDEIMSMYLTNCFWNEEAELEVNEPDWMSSFTGLYKFFVPWSLDPSGIEKITVGGKLYLYATTLWVVASKWNETKEYWKVSRRGLDSKHEGYIEPGVLLWNNSAGGTGVWNTVGGFYPNHSTLYSGQTHREFQGSLSWEYSSSNSSLINTSHTDFTKKGLLLVMGTCLHGPGMYNNFKGYYNSPKHWRKPDKLGIGVQDFYCNINVQDHIVGCIFPIKTNKINYIKVHGANNFSGNVIVKIHPAKITNASEREIYYTNVIQEYKFSDSNWNKEQILTGFEVPENNKVLGLTVSLEPGLTFNQSLPKINNYSCSENVSEGLIKIHGVEKSVWEETYNDGCSFIKEIEYGTYLKEIKYFRVNQSSENMFIRGSLLGSYTFGFNCSYSIDLIENASTAFVCTENSSIYSNKLYLNTSGSFVQYYIDVATKITKEPHLNISNVSYSYFEVGISKTGIKYYYNSLSQGNIKLGHSQLSLVGSKSFYVILKAIKTNTIGIGKIEINAQIASLSNELNLHPDTDYIGVNISNINNCSNVIYEESITGAYFE